jgi:Holliday junction resolvase
MTGEGHELHEGARMNSRSKGKRGEREFAALLREHGFDARRGQQFSGSAESPDVVSEALGWLHFEVKHVEHLNLRDACAQAEGDCGGKPWVVAHRRNHAPWLITMRAETFFDLVREFEPRRRRDAEISRQDEQEGQDSILGA